MQSGENSGVCVRTERARGVRRRKRARKQMQCVLECDWICPRCCRVRRVETGENVRCERVMERRRECCGKSAVQGASKHSMLILERVGNARVREL